MMKNEEKRDVNFYKYWGKANNDGNYHLLVYHCLDGDMLERTVNY